MRRLWDTVSQWWFYVRHPEERPVKGCSSWRYSCSQQKKHSDCADCGKLTCGRRMRIDPRTLKRHLIFLCDECLLHGSVSYQQRHLREERARGDWEKLSVPIEPAAIIGGRMGEQFPGRARAALRAFAASGEDVATGPDIGANVLQGSIESLGLDREMYAEQRDHDTILRRVEPPTRRARKAS